MFKLLTEEIKVKVEGEYNKRLVVVVLWILALVLLFALASLYPAYLLSQSRVAETSERVRVMGEATDEDSRVAATSWVDNISSKLMLLNPSLDAERPSENISDLINSKPDGVSIISLSWLPNSEGATLSASGVAQDRQTLLSFESQLKSSGNFEDVSFPVSNLAKENDIDFQMKLIPNKN